MSLSLAIQTAKPGKPPVRRRVGVGGMKQAAGGLTHIREQVRENDPRRVEVVVAQIDRYLHESRRDDGRVEAGEHEALEGAFRRSDFEAWEQAESSELDLHDGDGELSQWSHRRQRSRGGILGIARVSDYRRHGALLAVVFGCDVGK
jgi:hypothetical protein